VAGGVAKGVGELFGLVRRETGRLETDVEGDVWKAFAGELGGKQGAEFVWGSGGELREGFEDDLMVGFAPRVVGKTAQDAGAMLAGCGGQAKELEELELLLDAVRVRCERHRRSPGGILPIHGERAKE
jgi:hypothetical protein